MAGSTKTTPDDEATTKPFAPAEAPAATVAASPQRRPPPTKIGRYEVERLLGQGGMGRVWLARDTVLGRKVAIKVLRDDLSLPPKVHDELVVRMGHEAQAAAAVSHPNIVVLHDMGEDEALGLFLVFEYVTTKGDSPDSGSEVVVSLRDRLKHGPLPLPELAQLAREVGSALTFAHETGVIHRDIKPENILFSRTGFKIADFGIARIPDSTITRANTVLGTPAYTAPEALSQGDFGPASDQFALAATLYEAATATRAFRGEDAIATAGKVSSEPPPPLQESIGSPSAVRALDSVLQRGLSKSPEARFRSCAELGQAVARALERTDPIATPRRPVSGRPPPLVTPVPGRIELERTPLSSRLAIVERALSEHGGPVSSAGADTTRPSIFLRRQTHRFQNIAAGVALLVIILLVLLGRRSQHADVRSAAASASAAPAPAPNPTPKRPKPIAPQPTATDAEIDAAAAPVEAGE